MSSENKDVGPLKIESTNISTASGVELSSQQQTLVGSVLDLFAGRPSLAKLQLWKDEGEFIDPLTIAKGRKQFEPQCKLANVLILNDECQFSNVEIFVIFRVRPSISLL